jgi:pimeloyl-ACP methyl ester carboxylesterase
MKGDGMALYIAILFFLLIIVYFLFNPENKTLDENERKQLGGEYIELSDGITHYKLTGPPEGSVVVLIHGGTVPIWTWDSQIKALNDNGFRVLCYDHFGRGYSDRPNVKYGQELYKRQILELVDKLELTRKFALVGLSLGGATAANFTAQYPDRVRKLVLISPLINNFKVPGIFKIPVLGEFVARFLGIKIIVKRFSALFENNPNSEAYKRLFIEQTTYKGFQQSLISMLRGDAVGDYVDAYRALGKKERDILLIWGTEDTEVTGEMIKDIRFYLPHLQFKPVEGVGHGIVFQKPEIINSLIVDFL